MTMLTVLTLTATAMTKPSINSSSMQKAKPPMVLDLTVVCGLCLRMILPPRSLHTRAYDLTWAGSLSNESSVRPSAILLSGFMLILGCTSITISKHSFLQLTCLVSMKPFPLIHSFPIPKPLMMVSLGMVAQKCSNCMWVVRVTTSCCCPMQHETEVPGTFEDFMRDVRATKKLIRDNAKSETGK